MKNPPLLAALLIALVLLAAAPVCAADDPGVARLATCQDSWFDWQKSDPAQMKKFADRFRAAYGPENDDGSFAPKSPASIAGFRIERVYPESVGMGVGFSVAIDATFDDAKRAFEKRLGKPLVKCDASDGARECELAIAEKRTFMLMAPDDPKNGKAVAACYYFYEK